MNSISCPLLPIVQHTFIYALYAECLLKYFTFNVIWKREKSLQQRPGVLRSQLPLCTRVSTRRTFCSKKKLYCSPFVRFSDYKNCIVPATAPSSQHQLSDFEGDGNQQTNRSSESNAMLSLLPCRESIDDKNLPCSEWYFSFLAYTAEKIAREKSMANLKRRQWHEFLSLLELRLQSISVISSPFWRACTWAWQMSVMEFHAAQRWWTLKCDFPPVDSAMNRHNNLTLKYLPCLNYVSAWVNAQFSRDLNSHHSSRSCGTGV